jgi:hypothetical protein
MLCDWINKPNRLCLKKIVQHGFADRVGFEDVASPQSHAASAKRLCRPL